MTIDSTHPSQKSKIEVAYLDPLGVYDFRMLKRTNCKFKILPK